MITSAIWGLGVSLAVPVQAEEASPRSGVEEISEITVTARRIEERLQDVPVSITVYKQDQLDDANITNITDLTRFTPSLGANTRWGTDSASFTIRGFAQEQRTTASVATYFGEVVAPRGGATLNGGDGAGPGAFFDLQNVQVLNGPQGTLFGRNTTGGAVILVPKRLCAGVGEMGLPPAPSRWPWGILLGPCGSSCDPHPYAGQSRAGLHRSPAAFRS